MEIKREEREIKKKLCGVICEGKREKTKICGCMCVRKTEKTTNSEVYV